MTTLHRVFLAFASLLILTNCTANNNSDASNSEHHSLTVMSYNIKYDDRSDTPTGWEQRKERITNLISFHRPDFLGTQEGLQHQLDYMAANLDSMRWIGVGRTDGKAEGEYSALFYNAKRFELVADTDSTIWLSKTPGQPSKNWDAALPRILTFGKFRDRQTNNEFYVFNTHFDHVGDTARAESTKIILNTINAVTPDAPVIVTGDFNFTPDAQPYEILTGSSLRDTHTLAEGRHIGPEFTFSGFRVDPEINPRRIDYIFVSDHFTTGRHGAISDFSNGYYPSDHLPVITELTLSEIKSTAND